MNSSSANDNSKTIARGKLRDEYEIYASQARSMGWPVKSFDEWLDS